MVKQRAGTRQKRLPGSIETAWGIRERPVRGPKRGLSLDRIVDAAIKVASSDGLSAVSMGRVAHELGAATMSLYRYVGAKDELLALMIDRASRTPPEAPSSNERWRDALSRWARAHLAVLRRHPWILRIPVSGPPVMPNQMVWFERGLSCLGSTGLTEGEKISVLLLVNGFVRNDALLTADLQAAARASGSSMSAAMSSYGRLLSTLIDPARFPSIAKVISTGVFDGPYDEDDEFNFGLERVLDGVEALVEKRS
jgi:AcrR family transcriptional regulator